MAHSCLNGKASLRSELLDSDYEMITKSPRNAMPIEAESVYMGGPSSCKPYGRASEN